MDGSTLGVAIAYTKKTTSQLKSAVQQIEDVISTTGTGETQVELDISNTLVSGYRIITNVGVGNVVNLTPSSSDTYGYIISDCNDGDYFTVKGIGGETPRAWAFIDNANKIITVSSSYAIMTGETVYAPAGAVKAIFNLQFDSAYKVVRFTTQEATGQVFVDVKGIDSSFCSGNMFDKDTIIAGKMYDEGVITDDSNYYLSDFIAIKPSSAYTYRGINGAINYFDEDKGFISADSVTLYDSTTTKTSPSQAKYVRLQMRKLYYPYHNLVMNEGSTASKVFIHGKLLKENKKEPKQYEYSDIPIPGEYTAYGVKAVDGSSGTDFNNENPSLTDLYSAFDALVTAYPNYVTKEDLGTDQSGSYHIYAYHFIPESMTASSTYFRLPYPKINLLSGIHGSGNSGENCINIFCLYYLMKSICENWNTSDALEYFRWNVRFSVIPVQNPYGFVNGTRGNSRGVDLNRNFSIGWQLREQSSSEYGGTAPMSEAETIAIADFLEANRDAVFTIDMHGTNNSAIGQDSLVYCGTDPQDDIFYAIKSLITKMSHEWDSQNITGLTPANFHGFITGSIEGDGQMRAYAYAEKKMHSMVLEAFKNFTSSPYSSNSQEIMQMNADKLGYCLLYNLMHFKK